MDTIDGNKRGVSLLENLIAVVVFSIAALGYITLAASLSKNSGESEVSAQASVIAQSVADDLHTIPFDSQDQTPEDLTTLNGDQIFFTREGIDVEENGGEPFYTSTTQVAYIDTDTPPYAEVTVTVSWADSDFSRGQDDPDALTFVEVIFSRTVDK